MIDLNSLAQALTMAVNGHLMSMEHAAGIWKKQLRDEGLDVPLKPVATPSKVGEGSTETKS